MAYIVVDVSVVNLVVVVAVWDVDGVVVVAILLGGVYDVDTLSIRQKIKCQVLDGRGIFSYQILNHAMRILVFQWCFHE